MLQALLIVLCRPTAGQDDELNDWYSNIHLHDALRFRGSLAAQRFKLSDRKLGAHKNPNNWRYLALYEVSDALRFSQEHDDALGTPRMDIAQAFDNFNPWDFYYAFREVIDNEPGKPIAGSVVMQQFKVLPGKEAEFRNWYSDKVLRPTMAKAGVRSGMLLQLHDHQMFPQWPEQNFSAIYRLKDSAALNGWDGHKLVESSPLVDGATLETSSWDDIIPRLTKDEAQNPSAAFLAAEEKARARMGRNFINLKRDSNHARG